MKKLKIKSIRNILVSIILLVIIYPAFTQIFYKNSGESKSEGTVAKGKLINGYKFPYKEDNFKYYSFVDYYILGRCYIHSSIYKITLDAYAELKETYPDYTFRIMECSNRKGGRAFPHRTHQNGTSIDFMTPLKKEDRSNLFWDHTGMIRYALKFNSDGKLNLDKKIIIDFDKMALHIITLEKHARQEGYHIKKVILETNLKDELFDSEYGEKLKQTGIYFVKSLPKSINELHDDHYHIDFEKIK